jgi:hypothetical protein
MEELAKTEFDIVLKPRCEDFEQPQTLLPSTSATCKILAGNVSEKAVSRPTKPWTKIAFGCRPEHFPVHHRLEIQAIALAQTAVQPLLSELEVV